MNLSQRKAIPLAILLAVAAGVVAMFMFSGQFVFGHDDPEGCDTSTSGSLSVTILDGDGAVVTRVNNGTEVFYNIILSIAELPSTKTACNFEGGLVTMTLPNGDVVNVAGSDDMPEVGLVKVGSPLELEAVSYVVSQDDAEESVLRAQSSYTNGISHHSSGGTTDSVAQSQTSTPLLLSAPSIDITVLEEEQVVYEGGTADFTVTVTNDGGLALSNVQIVDSLEETDCEQTLEDLAVGDSASFSCQMVPTESADNEITALADVLGGVVAEHATVRDVATAVIALEAVAVEIELAVQASHVRLGNSSTYEITVNNPNTTELIDVAVAVEAAPECDMDIGILAAETTHPMYTCTTTHEAGTVLVTAVVTGEIEGVGQLTDSANVESIIFEFELVIEKTPGNQTIKEGDTAAFTVTVTNFGSTDLSDVEVTDDISPDCTRSLGILMPQSISEPMTYDCVSIALDDDTETTISVTGIAPDGGSVDHSATVNVQVLRPSTIVALTEIDTQVLRLVVQVLKVTETNNGDADLTDVYVDVDPPGVRLTEDPVRLTTDSKWYVGGDDEGDGILAPGETWEWRLVIVSVTGDHGLLAGDADTASVTATGHGTDPLGGDITFPAFATEQHILAVPIATQ